MPVQSQDLDFRSPMSWSVLCLVSSVKMRGDCSFFYWWDWWPSLFFPIISLFANTNQIGLKHKSTNKLCIIITICMCLFHLDSRMWLVKRLACNYEIETSPRSLKCTVILTQPLSLLFNFQLESVESWSISTCLTYVWAITC